MWTELLCTFLVGQPTNNKKRTAGFHTSCTTYRVWVRCRSYMLLYSGHLLYSEDPTAKVKLLSKRVEDTPTVIKFADKPLFSTNGSAYIIRPHPLHA